jgi:hypothetical protein
MGKTGTADLPLHYGKAPRWLFNRMVKLAKPISEIIIFEYGQEGFLTRISDPYFFQALGCVLGFDWHSSGLTTTVTGALKSALTQETGILIAGGKGKTSKETPKQIKEISEKFNLSGEKTRKALYASKIAAKVDNNLIQDSYSLYHHCFFLTEKGKWSIVQQGLQDRETGRGFARRYHWLSDNVENFVIEPETAIVSVKKQEKVLNLVSKNSEETQKISLDLVRDNPVHLRRFDKKLQNQKVLGEFNNEIKKIKLPERHEILKIDLGNFRVLESAYKLQPENYEKLVSINGMGAKTLRALALISSLIYGSNLSWKDPAKYSYAHGGKDGIPYPVDRELYDRDIEILNQAVKNARLNYKDKLNSLRRLRIYTENIS